MDTLSQTSQKNARKYSHIDRKTQAQLLEKCRFCSQREIARQQGIARSTLQHWKIRAQILEGKIDPELAQFFESPCGQVFLHTLYVATLLIFHKCSNCGIPALQDFFFRIQTDYFIGSSIPSLQRLDKALDQHIIAYREEESKRLAENMAHKNICYAVDENFILDRMTLVGMDPVSNYILLEELADDRKAETWDKASKDALKGLNVTVLHCVGDEAAGLIKLAKVFFNASKGSDLFHIQQEITRGLTSPLARSLEQAKRAKELLQQEKGEVLFKLTGHMKAAGSIKNLPKRGINAGKRLCAIDKEERKNDREIKAMEQRQENARTNRKSISEIYHPFHPETGEKQAPEQVKKALQSSFEALEGIANEQQLSDKQKSKLQKAKGAIDSMVKVLIFFFLFLATTTQALELREEETKAFETLVSLCYWKGRIRKTAGRKNKDKVRTLIQDLENKLNADPIWAELNPERQHVWQLKAVECAQMFQRSSSCVEGRNGHLSLKFHAFRHMTQEGLQVLTVLHNFFSTRADGTTAAERFFGEKPKDLFTYLLGKIELSRPRTAYREKKCAVGQRPEAA